MEEERRELIRVRVECLTAMLRLHLEEDNLKAMLKTATALCSLSVANKWPALRDYLTRTLSTFSTVDHSDYD